MKDACGGGGMPRVKQFQTQTHFQKIFKQTHFRLLYIIVNCGVATKVHFFVVY